MVISIRVFPIFLIACLYWTSAHGEDEVFGRLDSMTGLPANLDMGVPKARESSTLTLSGGQGAGGLEVGEDSDDDAGPGGAPHLADRLVYRGIQATIVAEYMYRL